MSKHTCVVPFHFPISFITFSVLAWGWQWLSSFSRVCWSHGLHQTIWDYPGGIAFSLACPLKWPKAHSPTHEWTPLLCFPYSYPLVSFTTHQESDCNPLVCSDPQFEVCCFLAFWDGIPITNILWYVHSPLYCILLTAVDDTACVTNQLSKPVRFYLVKILYYMGFLWVEKCRGNVKFRRRKMVISTWGKFSGSIFV